MRNDFCLQKSKSVSSVERFSRSERANKSSPPVLGGVPEPTVLSRMAKNGGGGLLSVSSVESVGDKSNSDAKKSVEIQRALLTKSNSESLNPNGKKSFKSVNQRSLSLWREKSVGDNHSEGVTSVSSVNQRSLSPWRENSVREKENSVRDKKISVRDKNSAGDKTLEMALLRIETHSIDVTTCYHDWYRIGMALASHYGEAGRDYYHRISRFYPRYTPLETNQQYDRCLRYNTHRIRLGTLFYLLNI